MSSSKLIFRVHAVKRMFSRGISAEEVRRALLTGEVIEEYNNDKPYPSRLVLAWSGERPLHVVAAENMAAGETIVITVYEPNPDGWDSDFKRRKRP